MNRQQKIEIAQKLKEKLAKAKSVVLADYRGLTHRQMEEIKKALKSAGAEFVVTKNTLLSRSFPASSFQLPASSLTGPTATLFSYDDEIAPLSVLAKFIKNFGRPQIKIGLLADKIFNAEEILKIANLPSREILMATLVNRLKSPVYRLNYALNYNLTKLALVLKAKAQKV